MASKGDKQGRILSQHITLSKSGKKIANNNMIVVGAPGTGKSFRIVAPNLLRNDASVVVLDVKGDLLRNYGKAMEKNGYQIKCLDVISSDFGKSHMYNPFVYVKTEVDMIRLVNIYEEWMEHKVKPYILELLAAVNAGVVSDTENKLFTNVLNEWLETSYDIVNT